MIMKKILQLKEKYIKEKALTPNRVYMNQETYDALREEYNEEGIPESHGKVYPTEIDGMKICVEPIDSIIIMLVRLS